MLSLAYEEFIIKLHHQNVQIFSYIAYPYLVDSSLGLKKKDETQTYLLLVPLDTSHRKQQSDTEGTQRITLGHLQKKTTS